MMTVTGFLLLCIALLVGILPEMIDFSTFVLLGGGPSLMVEDVEYVRDKARVIAINNAYTLAPWAFALYAADSHWIEWENGAPSFRGHKYSIESHDTTKRSDWTVLRNTGYVGLETEPGALRTGFNGGFQAINLAVHFGAKRIILLGFDMTPAPDGRGHWHPEHPDGKVSPYEQMREAFNSLVEPLAVAGVSVINCSRRTALTAFPCRPLDSVFNGDDVLRYLSAISDAAKADSRVLGHVEAVS